MTYDVVINGDTHRVELQRIDDNNWRCKVDSHEMELNAAFTARDVLSILIGGKAYEIKRERALNGDTHMILGSARYSSDVQDPRSLRSRRAAAGAEAGPARLVAPMPGKVVRVMVSANDQVEPGQGIVVVEAMKMQNELKAPKKGVVQKIMVAEGANVNAGDPLAIID